MNDFQEDHLATARLRELKLTRDELETRHRIGTTDELARLEAILNEEQERLLVLRQTIDRDQRDRNSREKIMFKHQREAEFYKRKLESEQLEEGELERKYTNLRLAAKEVEAKRERIRKLHKSLERFGDFEPSEESLIQRIDQLKKSRLSLDMTFVDDSLSF